MMAMSLGESEDSNNSSYSRIACSVSASMSAWLIPSVGDASVASLRVEGVASVSEGDASVASVSALR